MGKTKTNTGALVNEVLTTKQVRELVKMTDYRNPNWNMNHISIFKGWYESWDGTRFEGYIVLHVHRETTVETVNDFMPTYVEHNDYYFMEVEKELVTTSLNGRTYTVQYHALVPITSQYVPVKDMSENGNAKDLCDYIVSKACRDKWDYIKAPMADTEVAESKKKMDYHYWSKDYSKLVPLTLSDIGYWYEPLTDVERKEMLEKEKAKENALIALFSTGELPSAEDDAWYSILSSGYGTSGYDLETKIIKILRNRGYSVRIDGEKDSFGWVTRGIWVDGEMMAIY